ncbi:ATP-dependent DNA helicase DDX31 [Anomaloglossus baeobatrachus]|uniref:ATP-dependent DNA helicase DDX31 n=1 Tax=Anomaloglossus baeobatrachus TaxID=238106 RepID=UPI003F509E84
MGEQGLILNISEAPVQEYKTVQRSQQPAGKWQKLKALKRKKSEDASGAPPPAAKRPALPPPPAAKRPALPPPPAAKRPALPPPPAAKRPALPPPPAAKRPALPPPPAAKRPAFPPPPAAKRPALPPPPAAKRPAFPPPPAAKRPALPPPPAAKRPALPSPSPKFHSKKSKADVSPRMVQALRNEGRPKGGRPAIKTSSLFKNNPELPDIERSDVRPLQEKVFSSDSFSELGLHPHLVATLTNVLEMSRMTSVQKMTIPALLSGRDAMVRSQTGSGKTLAYGVPLVQRLQEVTPKIQRSHGPYALILVPTRELALQSFTIIQKLLKPFTWIVPGVLMGGEKRKSEKARLRKGINILISTPGRLVDHIRSTKNIHFTHVRWLVVDEADRILDLGFEKDLTAIMNALNAQSERRQNVLLSATLSQGVTRLADISLHSPVAVSVGADPRSEPMLGVSSPVEQGAVDSFAVPERLLQHAVVVPSKLKLVTLAAFILGKWQSDPKPKMIVFFPSCELVEFHHTLLSNVLPLQPRAGDPAVFLRLHGGMAQEERTDVFQQFSGVRAGILLCTDVAARGLDLPQVTWIVQYNAPVSVEEYIHRVGRTARLGARGSSLLVLIPSEAEYIQTLVNHKISVSEMKMEEILSNLLPEEFLIIKRGKRRPPGGSMEQVERSALQSYIRSYATYPKNLKQIFHVRSLHLGHVAKSFGLRDAPHNLSQQLAGNPKRQKAMKNKRSDKHRTARTKQRFSDLLTSEFSSGLPPKPKKTKTPPNNNKTS